MSRRKRSYTLAPALPILFLAGVYALARLAGRGYSGLAGPGVYAGPYVSIMPRRQPAPRRGRR